MAAFVLLAGIQCDRSTPDEAWVEHARRMTDDYQAALKGKLVEAMNHGGPPHAVRICNVEAPKIEGQVASGTTANWTVSRTALRVRNPKNRPNDWQREVLAEFERRLAKGEPVEGIDWRGRRGERFVYMRPIVMGGLCTTCHGPPESIPVAVRQELTRLYPNDEATGFSVSELRGAFVVTGPRTLR